ncbi:MAG: hypothetical protein ABEJ31_11740 [Haloarculaceae archaeon]
MSIARQVWDSLESEFGSALRIVIRYHPSEFESIGRSDVEAEYSPQEIQSVVDEVIIDQLSTDKLRTYLNLGDLNSSVRSFERAWVLLYPDELDHKSGFVVSIQRDDPDVSMDAMETIEHYLVEDIEPQLS